MPGRIQGLTSVIWRRSPRGSGEDAGVHLQRLHSACQVLKMPVSAMATFLDAITQAGTSNGFPGYSVLGLAVAQPGPSPSPSPSPALSAPSPPVSINPNNPSPSPALSAPSPPVSIDPSPSPTPKPGDISPTVESPRLSPGGDPTPPTEEGNATATIIVIVVVVVLLVIAAGLTVAYFLHKKSGPGGLLGGDRPSSQSSLKSGGSVITVKSNGMWWVRTRCPVQKGW